MTCRDTEVLLFWDRTSEQEALLREHALVCRECAKRLELEDSLLKALRQEARATRFLQPSAATDRSVLESFRGRTGVPRRAIASLTGWPVAAAAAVLLAVLVAVVFDRGNVDFVPHEGTEELAQAGQDPGASGSGRLGRGTTSAGEGAAVEGSGWPLEADLATDFFALTSCPELRCLEGAQHVRVSLPRSSMTYFGLPVSNPGGSDRIDADVFVGVDGVARAIRFVQPVSVEMK